VIYFSIILQCFCIYFSILYAVNLFYLHINPHFYMQ
jgi:hypothetical protein